MRRILVHSRVGEYPVVVAPGAQIGKLLAESGIDLAARAVVMISDSNTEKIAQRVGGALCAGSVLHHSVPAGEGSKSIAGANEIWEFFAAKGIARDALIVAVGGGVVGDLAGFAASSWMRGIDLVQLPTTLMAQVDSSIGGKVGVNLSHGKNLVGAFYPPKAVVIDPQLLRTLPESVLRDGFAEVVKYGVIFDRALLESVERWSASRAEPLLCSIVERCAELKGAVVSEDEFERGQRRITLNFGHTFGHALEAAAEWGLTHGEAVAAGMVMEAEFGVMRGVTEPEVPRQIRALLEQLGFELKPFKPAGLVQYLRMDKKRRGGAVQMVLPTRIGEYLPISAGLDDLSDWLSRSVDVSLSA